MEDERKDPKHRVDDNEPIVEENEEESKKRENQDEDVREQRER